MYGATTAIGASYFHLHVLCWIRACMFFFHVYLTLGFLFNLCLCDFDLPASKDGATDNFLFQRCNQPEAFQYFQLHGKWCWQTAPQSWNLQPYYLHPWWQNRQTAKRRKAWHRIYPTNFIKFKQHHLRMWIEPGIRRWRNSQCGAIYLHLGGFRSFSQIPFVTGVRAIY